MTIEPEPKWNKSKFLPPLELDIDPARQGIYAGDLPSAARHHTPATDDFPRGWTVQQPYFHPEYVRPAQMRCTLCGLSHPASGCGVLVALAVPN